MPKNNLLTVLEYNLEIFAFFVQFWVLANLAPIKFCLILLSDSFQIDSATGELFVTKAFDREAYLDIPETDQPRLTIRASDDTHDLISNISIRIEVHMCIIALHHSITS